MVGTRVCACLCDGSGQLLYMEVFQILHLLGIESKYSLSLGCAETVYLLDISRDRKRPDKSAPEFYRIPHMTK